MRIISQFGDKDLDYDFLSIHIDNTSIKAENVYNIEYAIILAQYSTPEKALKAMEMLHNDYLLLENNTSNNFPKIFQFPQDEEVNV